MCKSLLPLKSFSFHHRSVCLFSTNVVLGLSKNSNLMLIDISAWKHWQGVCTCISYKTMGGRNQRVGQGNAHPPSLHKIEKGRENRDRDVPRWHCLIRDPECFILAWLSFSRWNFLGLKISFQMFSLIPEYWSFLTQQYSFMTASICPCERQLQKFGTYVVCGGEETA